jgi:hypothetical protein
VASGSVTMRISLLLSALVNWTGVRLAVHGSSRDCQVLVRKIGLGGLISSEVRPAWAIMDAVGTRVAGAAAWARWGIRDGCGGLRLKGQRVASGQKGVARGWR